MSQLRPATPSATTTGLEDGEVTDRTKAAVLT